VLARPLSHSARPRRWRAPLLAVVCAAALIPAIAMTPSLAVAEARRAGPNAASDVTLHLFQWPWLDVARECVQVLGPAGYGACR
jgi:alpha-amylase